MKRLRGWFALLRALPLVLAMLLCVAAAHAASPHAARIDRLMEASGINHSIGQVLPGILGGLDETRQPMPAQVRAALRDAAMQSFRSAPMLETFRARLGTLSAAQVDDALRWLDTPLGRRITALENAAAEPGAAAKIEAYVQSLQTKPAPAGRVRLIEDLNRATGAQDVMNDIMEAILLGSALGVNAAQPRERQVPAEALRKQIKSGMPEVQRQTEQFVMSSMLYTYRPLADSDIETYIRFARSPSGAAYQRIGTAGLRDALLAAVARFMNAIPKAMERSKGAVGT